ncbi:MAG: FCD domain-containing protein, partial [Bacteroidota bacterium]
LSLLFLAANLVASFSNKKRVSTRLAARNRSDKDILKLESALQLYEQKVISNQEAVEEDLLFHIQIAEAGKNLVLKSLMMIITPDIVKSFIKLKVCNENDNDKTIEEHRKILQSIKNQDEDSAVLAMEKHLEDVKNFNTNYKIV